MFGDLIKSVFTPTGASWGLVIITALALIKQIHNGHIYNMQAHEEHRRETACNVIHKWSINLTREESVAKKVVEKFNEHQIKKLLDERRFSVSAVEYRKLQNIFPNSVDRQIVGNRQVLLTIEEVSLLRWFIVKYLNNLESTLLVCKQGIADVDVFIEQYKYQFNTPKDVAALRKYRESVGGIDSYPAIEWFCILMDKREKERILEKDKVDNHKRKGFSCKFKW